MTLILLVVVAGVFFLLSGVRTHARTTGSKAAYRLILGPTLIALGVMLFPFVLASRLLMFAGVALTGVAALGIALSKRKS